MTGPTQVQTTVFARRLECLWTGAALTGPSGVGKSSLALQLMSEGWHLVADDAALVWISGGRLWARSPRSIAGRIEVRGLGLIEGPHLDICRLDLVITLGLDEPERLPDPVHAPWLGIPLRTIAVQARAAAAPQIVSRALNDALRRKVSP